MAGSHERLRSFSTIALVSAILALLAIVWSRPGSPQRPLTVWSTDARSLITWRSGETQGVRSRAAGLPVALDVLEPNSIAIAVSNGDLWTTSSRFGGSQNRCSAVGVKWSASGLLLAVATTQQGLVSVSILDGNGVCVDWFATGITLGKNDKCTLSWNASDSMLLVGSAIRTEAYCTPEGLLAWSASINRAYYISDDLIAANSGGDSVSVWRWSVQEDRIVRLRTIAYGWVLASNPTCEVAAVFVLNRIAVYLSGKIRVVDAFGRSAWVGGAVEASTDVVAALTCEY